jgi:hypothetical protein
MRHKFLILITIVFIFSVFHSTEAQIIYGQKGYFSSGIIYADWKVQDNSETQINEWVGVVRIFLPLSDNLEMRFFSTGTAADLTNSVSEKNLSGMKKLTDDEAEVASLLADNSMRFPVRRYGEGLDISTGLAVAKEVGSVILGLGAGYLKKGEYTPFSTKPEKYKPGDELVFNLGLDLKKEKTFLRFDGVLHIS